MLRKILIVLLCLAFTDSVAGQDDLAEAVRLLVGDSQLETLEASQVETLHALYLRPININDATRSRLESTGLFTPFQLASLVDYRSRHGSIMSIKELAFVDGFTSESAAALEPFIVLESRMQNRSRTSMFSGDVSFRYGYKMDKAKDVNKSTYGFKSRISLADKITLTLAATEPYDSLKVYPTVYSASILWHHRAGKIVVGDFNARFGQGVCLWNTASFSSLNTPSSFMKRPSGVAAVNSFTGSSALTGIAADLALGRWQLSAMLSLPGVKQLSRSPDELKISPALNLIRFGRFGHIGCTHYMSFTSYLTGSYRIPSMLTSIDASSCIRGVNLFGEGAYDWVERRFSILAGSEFGIADNVRAAVMGRYLPGSNEHGASISSEILLDANQIQASVDAIYHPVSKSKYGNRSYQVKGQINWMWKINSIWMTKLRLAERVRTWGISSKTELRTEVVCTCRNWKTSFRADVLYGSSMAGLVYVETGYLADRISAYLRYGMFHIDNWDDRIYVYERDAPGNFTVPSFYKRGLWISGYVAYRPSDWCKLYLRGIYKKPGNAELKLYCTLEF